MKRILLAAMCAVPMALAAQESTFSFGTKVSPQGSCMEVDSHGLVIDGHHVLPVMGEIHYSRVPEREWRNEIQKMKAGGITMVATYCFWIHHEPAEGRWDWSGNKNLHRFLETCKEEGMPVVLRIGPFCHGEVYQGGFPDWIVQKAAAEPERYKIRSEAPGFMAATQRLYSNIFAQVSDMLWKHGGPVVGVQIENECRGPWSYYMALKDMAVAIGFDVPFYTRTGWPKLNGKEEFGRLLPLYGDYADGFWDRSLSEMPGGYSKAFTMKDTRVSDVIATETFGTNQDTRMEASDMKYPYLTCELGGGMMTSYHRRINMSGREAMPLAVCKLGSGSNLPGYYMYHGGTNPAYAIDGQPQTMGETQASTVTNHNDMPYMSYDFQCPLGEMGQPNVTAFHETRLLHQMLADWGETLAVMDVDTLSEHYARRGCFEFRNDYVRILNEEGTAYVRPVDMPFHGHGITADAQPFCTVGDTLYLVAIKGMKPSVTIDGKRHSVKADKPLTAKGITVEVLSAERAQAAFKIDGKLHFATHPGAILYKDGDSIVEEYWQEAEDITATKTSEAAAPRSVTTGKQKVAAMPSNEDFKAAAVWTLQLPDTDDSNLFLQIDYEADCARVYADGQLVEDNFWNGKPMLVRLSDIAKRKAELRILPLTREAPIYLQKEQRGILDAAPNGVLLNLKGVKLLRRHTTTHHHAPAAGQVCCR